MLDANVSLGSPLLLPGKLKKEFLPYLANV
jgi:hypothetical protein